MPMRREVVVGPREALRTRRIALRDVNWLGDETLASFAQSGDEVSGADPLERAFAAGAGVHPRTARRSSISLTARTGSRPDRLASSIVQATVGSGFSAAAGSSRAEGGAWLAKDGFRAAASRGPGEALAAGSR